MKERSEIEEKYKWDLTKFCKNDEEYYNKLSKIEKYVDEIKKYENRLKDDKVLLDYLNLKIKIEKDIAFTSYAYYRRSENMADRKANEMIEKGNIILTKLSTALSAVDVEISKFPLVKLKKLQHSPQFKGFERYFEEEIRQKKHSLSKKEELILSQINEFVDGYSDCFDKLNDVDIKFDKIEDSKGKFHEFSNSKYMVFAESEDRKLRENAFKEINGKRGDFINVLSSTYINDVKIDCILAKLRKYKSALEQSIYCEEASVDVYRMLIKKVREQVVLLQRFFEIKRKMLGLNEFAIFDTFAPVTKESNKKFTYEEAIEIIKKAVSVLGKEYVDLIDRAKNERWIDVYPNKNKESGAYSSGNVGYTPVVMTNFEGNLESVFTLAHELGHAMHSYFSHKVQPIQTSEYVIFVAEVASNVNEQLLLNYLLNNAKTEKEKIYYYDHFLKDVKSSIFRQTMFAEFEEFAHEQYEKEIPLSAELLCDEYEKLNRFYHGNKVVQIPEMKYEWARIPHFYNSFYVYKYATGLICAIKIARNLISDPNFAKKYLTFLSSGSSKDPISLLKIADCDLTKEKTFDEAFDVCRGYIEKWEKLLNE